MVDGAHDHPLIQGDIVNEHTAMEAEIARLEARIVKLETTTPPPVITPPPVTGTPVPTSIDATGKTDTMAALTAWLLSLPNGATAVFNGGMYRIDGAIKLGGRKDLTIEGEGATIKAGGTGYNENYSLLYFQTFPGVNSNIKVHGLNLVGNSPTPGGFISGKEGQHGILIDGGSGFEVWGCTFAAMYGDALEVNSNATGVKFHDNTVTTTGRNGVSVIYGNGVEVYNNTFARCGYCAFDVEPNTSAQPCYSISIHGNTVGSWGNAFFALDGSQTGAAFHDIVVYSNIAVGSSLLTVVTGPGRKQRIGFTRNSGTGTATVSFQNVDGLTVTGNTGVTVKTTSCTAAVTSPNP